MTEREFVFVPLEFMETLVTIVEAHAEEYPCQHEAKRARRLLEARKTEKEYGEPKNEALEDKK